MFLNDLLNSKLECFFCHKHLMLGFKSSFIDSYYYQCNNCLYKIKLDYVVINQNRTYKAEAITLINNKYFIAYWRGDCYYMITNLLNNSIMNTLPFDLSFSSLQSFIDSIETHIIFS